MKIIQKVPIEFAWQYLVLAVDVIRCQLHWGWVSRRNQAQLMPLFQSWSPAAVVWDGASAHDAQAMRQLGFALLPRTQSA